MSGGAFAQGAHYTGGGGSCKFCFNFAKPGVGFSCHLGYTHRGDKGRGEKG